MAADRPEDYVTSRDQRADGREVRGRHPGLCVHRGGHLAGLPGYMRRRRHTQARRSGGKEGRALALHASAQSCYPGDAEQYLFLAVLKEPSPNSAFHSTQGRYGGYRSGMISANGRAR